MAPKARSPVPSESAFRPLRVGEMPGPHIDLDRRDYEFWHSERFVACAPHGDELILADAVADVNVVRALLGDGGFPTDLAIIGP